MTNARIHSVGKKKNQCDKKDTVAAPEGDPYMFEEWKITTQRGRTRMNRAASPRRCRLMEERKESSLVWGMGRIGDWIEKGERPLELRKGGLKGVHQGGEFLKEKNCGGPAHKGGNPK